MLVVETVGRIRREHFVQGKSIKEIARDLRMSRNTVRKVLRCGETSFAYERDVQPQPKLGRWKSDLDWMLAENAAKPTRERLTLIRLFEDLMGWAMRAAMTRFVAMRGVGSASTRARPHLPLCRCRLRLAKPTSSTEVTRSSC